MHTFEHLRGDDRWRIGENLLSISLLAPRFAVDVIEPPTAAVDWVSQQLMDGAVTPHAAPAGPIAAIVQPGRDSLGAHRRAAFVAAHDQLEDELHLFGFDRIDLKPLLYPCATFLDLHGAITEWCRRSVPEPLPSVLLHRPQDVLGVFLRLVFVEQRNHLPHHHLRRIITQLLRHRDQLDAMLGQLPDVEFEPKGIAEEPRVRMHDDHIEWIVSVAGTFDHTLEFRALVIHRRSAGLDVLGDDGPAARSNPICRLRALIRNRQVMFGLSSS